MNPRCGVAESYWTFFTGFHLPQSQGALVTLAFHWGGGLPPSFGITGTLVLPHFLPPLQKVIAHKADVQGMSLHATSPAWQLGDSRLSQAATTIGCEWL